MSLVKTRNPDFILKDDRGCLVQLVRSGYSQVNVITSVKGAERGGHYHKLNSEVFYIVQGRVRLEAWDIKDELKESYIFGEGSMFEIPPDIAHSFVFEDKTLLVSMYDKGVELGDGRKDILAAFEG